jgi:hypothetical protein
MSTRNYQNFKRKIFGEKEIFSFLLMLEDKFENNSEKLVQFSNIFRKYSYSKYYLHFINLHQRRRNLKFYSGCYLSISNFDTRTQQDVT